MPFTYQNDCIKYFTERNTSAMKRFFNVNGVRQLDRHGMVNLATKLEKQKMADAGDYFTITLAAKYRTRLRRTNLPMQGGRLSCSECY